MSMKTPALWFVLVAVAGALPAPAQENSNAVFRSDVSLVRVDAQVVDRNNRAISGLTASDFILRDEGQPRDIRNFSTEDMPVDVLLLFDVSASMRPHVQRIASAADQAMTVLKDQDRVGIMVFDRESRLRLGFRDSRAEVQRELRAMLRDERFNGGTDITRGLIDAAEYVGREARPNARRAIIVVTDDQTEANRDEAAVSRALEKSNAVLCALIAPDAMRSGRRQNGGWGRGGGGQWPGSGGGAGWPGGGLGGIIFGRRGGYGGGGGGRGPMPGGGMGPRTQSAGTAEIARESGGDSMPVNDASALQDTLSRIRQMYALNFYMPPDAKPNEERSVEVELAAAARHRYPDAELHYRRTYIAPATAAASAASTQQPAAAQQAAKSKPAVDEQSGGWPRVIK
jgi:VWFA-related protein